MTPSGKATLIPVMIGPASPSGVGALYYYNCSPTAITKLVMPSLNVSQYLNITASLPPQLNSYTGYAWPADIMTPIYSEQKVVVNGTLTNCEMYANHGVGFKTPLFWINIALTAIKTVEFVLFCFKGMQRQDNLFNNWTSYFGVNPMEFLSCVGTYIVLYMVMLTQVGVVTDIQLGMFLISFGFAISMSYFLRVAIHSFMDTKNGPSWPATNKTNTMLLTMCNLFVSGMWVFWGGCAILVITVVSDFAGVFYANLASFSDYTDSPTLIICCWVLVNTIFQFGLVSSIHIIMIQKCFPKTYDKHSGGDIVTLDRKAWDEKWLHWMVVFQSLILWILMTVTFSICLAATNKIATVAATY